MNAYKKGTSPEQKEIIDEFFRGATVEQLAKRVAATRTIKSNSKREVQMPLKDAREIVGRALLKINWN